MFAFSLLAVALPRYQSCGRRAFTTNHLLLATEMLKLSPQMSGRARAASAVSAY